MLPLPRLLLRFGYSMVDDELLMMIPTLEHYAHCKSKATIRMNPEFADHLTRKPPEPQELEPVQQEA